MWRKLGQPKHSRILLDDVPNHFFGHFVAPNRARSTYAVEIVCHRPRWTRSTKNQSCCFTQSGIGIVRTWPPFPTKSTMAQ